MCTNPARRAGALAPRRESRRLLAAAFFIVHAHHAPSGSDRVLCLQHLGPARALLPGARLVTGPRNGRRPGSHVGRVIPDHCITQILERVGVAETDMMGIVHHKNYVAYFEKGRLEYMRRRGVPYKDVVGRGIHMPVVELNIRYKKPAHFDDVLSVETRLGALTRVTVRFDYTIRRPPLAPTVSGAEPELLLEGQILLACVDEKHRPRALPEDIVSILFLPEASPGEDLSSQLYSPHEGGAAPDRASAK